MKSKKGIWEVSTGKCDRIYINCKDKDKIMHPQDLCSHNGLGMYGYHHLKDLAIAILLFEKQQQYNESIMFGLDNQDSEENDANEIEE